MKSIGLIIVHSGSNYGALLQAYASQQVIDGMGYKTEIISVGNKESFKDKYINFLKHFVPVLFNSSFKSFMRKQRLNKNNDLFNANSLRIKNGKNFINENLHDIVFYENLSELEDNIEKKYSTVLIGSDQQWTPQCFLSKINSLRVVPDSVNKVSFSTSMGVSELPWYMKSSIKKSIMRIEHVSVRETTGQKLLQKITGRNDIEVLPDPTLMFDNEEWINKIPVIKNDCGKYVFCYFLGNDGIGVKKAIEFARKYNLKVLAVKNIEIFEKNNTDYEDSIVLNAPSIIEFVNYIRNAEVVFTDSFHGTIFSLINQKKFVAFYRTNSKKRDSRNSRIDDLLTSLSLQNRIFKNNDLNNIAFSNINYEEVNAKIKEMRSKAKSFLSNSLK